MTYTSLKSDPDCGICDGSGAFVVEDLTYSVTLKSHCSCVTRRTMPRAVMATRVCSDCNAVNGDFHQPFCNTSLAIIEHIDSKK